MLGAGAAASTEGFIGSRLVATSQATNKPKPIQPSGLTGVPPQVTSNGVRKRTEMPAVALSAPCASAGAHGLRVRR